MECEHAFGPSFVLSPRDLARLGDQIAAANREPNTRVVGWYHSHTRSEIFLSEQDLEIHNRFFPEPWQLALVLKPHTFQPMRAGFFFRENSGAIHTEAPYSEIVLQPLPMRPALVNGTVEPSPVLPVPRDSDGQGRIVDISTVVEVEPAVTEPEPEVRSEVPPPTFLAPAAEKSRSWAPWLAVALGLGLGAWGYQSRGEWMPKLSS